MIKTKKWIPQCTVEDVIKYQTEECTEKITDLGKGATLHEWIPKKKLMKKRK